MPGLCGPARGGPNNRIEGRSISCYWCSAVYAFYVAPQHLVWNKTLSKLDRTVHPFQKRQGGFKSSVGGFFCLESGLAQG